MLKRFANIWVLLAAIFLLVGLVDKSWFMPGPVSRPHARIEGECERCHPGFSGTPNESCLACKTDMKLIQDRGVHKFAPIKQCADCHVEHRTRDYPLARDWVRPTEFDHDWTGFALKPYHEKTVCAQCHPENRPYREVETTCEGCHKDFNPAQWKHDSTGCGLDAIHDGLACGLCHDHGWGEPMVPACDHCHPAGKYQFREACEPADTPR